MPPPLAAAVEGLARERRPAAQVVRDALGRYLELRREQRDQTAAPRKDPAQFLMESPFCRRRVEPGKTARTYTLTTANADEPRASAKNIKIHDSQPTGPRRRSLAAIIEVAPERDAR